MYCKFQYMNPMGISSYIKKYLFAMAAMERLEEILSQLQSSSLFSGLRWHKWEIRLMVQKSGNHQLSLVDKNICFLVVNAGFLKHQRFQLYPHVFFAWTCPNGKGTSTPSQNPSITGFHVSFQGCDLWDAAPLSKKWRLQEYWIEILVKIRLHFHQFSSSISGQKSMLQVLATTCILLFFVLPI